MMYSLFKRGRRQLDASVSAMATAAVSQITSAAAVLPSGILSDVPDVVTGEITVSNTQAAAPQETAAARGLDRGDTSPLPTCSPSQGFGQSCDQSSGLCW